MSFWRCRVLRKQDRAEAEEIARRIASEVADRAPDALRLLVDVPDRFEIHGRTGVTYQVVVEAWPQNREGKVLEIVVSVDGGSVSAIRPVGWVETVTLDD